MPRASRGASKRPRAAVEAGARDDPRLARAREMPQALDSSDDLLREVRGECAVQSRGRFAEHVADDGVGRICQRAAKLLVQVGETQRLA
jgi:hypothetical protein